MVALNFKAEFIVAIDEGQKRRTIRRIRKAGNPKPGDCLQLYAGLRTTHCEKIRDATCTRVRRIYIDAMGVRIDNRTLYSGEAPASMGAPRPDDYDSDFARADGFDSFADMAVFFEKQYGLPFEGQLIEWRLGVDNGQSTGE